MNIKATGGRDLIGASAAKSWSTGNIYVDQDYIAVFLFILLVIARMSTALTVKVVMRGNSGLGTSFLQSNRRNWI